MVNRSLLNEERIVSGPPHNGGGFIERLTPFVRMFPSCFILGAQKSGTTSLFYNLARHPGIVRPKRKEIFYFDNLNRYKKGVNWYRSYFPVSFVHRGKITLDASTGYLDAAEAPQRIKSLLPDSRFIIILRNPVDRAFSHYRMAMRFGFEKADFYTALMEEKERIAWGENLPHNYYYAQLGYAARGEYATFLKNWFAHFDRSRFLILDLQEWENQPGQVYDQMLKFLELPAHHPADFEIKNAGEENARMDEPSRVFLENHFTAHNAALQQLLNRKFSWM